MKVRVLRIGRTASASQATSTDGLRVKVTMRLASRGMAPHRATADTFLQEGRAAFTQSSAEGGRA